MAWYLQPTQGYSSLITKMAMYNHEVLASLMHAYMMIQYVQYNTSAAILLVIQPTLVTGIICNNSAMMQTLVYTCIIPSFFGSSLLSINGKRAIKS